MPTTLYAKVFIKSLLYIKSYIKLKKKNPNISYKTCSEIQTQEIKFKAGIVSINY